MKKEDSVTRAATVEASPEDGSGQRTFDGSKSARLEFGLLPVCRHCLMPRMNCDCDGQFEPLLDVDDEGAGRQSMSVVTGHTCDSSGVSGSLPLEQRQAECRACQQLKERRAVMASANNLIYDAACAVIKLHVSNSDCAEILERCGFRKKNGRS